LIPGGNIDKIYILSKSQGLVAAKLPPFFGKKPTFIQEKWNKTKVQYALAAKNHFSLSLFFFTF
jgi:hypothetical protein